MRSLIVAFLMLVSSSVSAQYYDTLPKGVRLLSNRYIQANVESSYNRTESETPYIFEIDASIENLEKLDNPLVQDALALLKPYPEAYKNLSLGTHKIDANAQLDINVYALAYGVTDRVTIYMGAPIYDAKVNVKYSRSKNSSNKKVAEILQNKYGDDWAQTLGNLVDNIYDVDENLIQSGLVNALGYDELGSWEGTGFGDTEFGIMYNFLRTEKYGVMATFGGNAPTGYVDDPDLLQDIGFGDGQWDAFFELGGGYFISNSIVFNTWARYTYQFESEKKLRAPYSEDVFISDQKISFKEKLGNKLKLGFDTEVFLSDWLKIQPGYIFGYTEKANYKSNNSYANDLLSKDSESSFHSFKVLAQLSSVKLFQKNKFILPAQINVSVEKMLEGKNTAKVDTFEVDLRMFF